MLDIILLLCYNRIMKGRGKPKKNPQPKGGKDNTMKRYEWTLTDGRKVTLEAEYSETMQNKIVDLDGDIFDTGKREIVKKAKLVAYIDGKQFDVCTDVNFWQTIETGHTGIKKIWGIKQIAFTDDRAAEITSFLTSVIEDGRNQEAQQIRAEEKATEIAEQIKAAEELIIKAEAQQEIPTRDEAKRRMKRYNDINNEGGEGYVPYIISLEEYEYAKNKLAELQKG